MVVLLMMFAVAHAHAADLSERGAQLHVSGMLDGSAAQAFADRLRAGGVQLVVFEDALGGSAEVASAYAEAIQKAGVSTEIVGQCHAACAYAFLAGRTHRFGEGEQVNALFIPVPARPAAAELGTRWSGDGARRTLAEFSVDSSPMASAAPLPLPGAGSSGSPGRWRPEHGLLFVSAPTLFGPVYNTYYCDGSQGRDLTQCELMADADPRRLGILSD